MSLRYVVLFTGLGLFNLDSAKAYKRTLAIFHIATEIKVIFYVSRSFRGSISFRASGGKLGKFYIIFFSFVRLSVGRNV